METLTEEQKATNYETYKHIRRVQELLNLCATKLIERGNVHDESKLHSPEVELFTEYTSKLAGCTYGSEEYEDFRKKLWPALEHHYAKNRHHPEHHLNGVGDMNLLDLIEMFVDWKAAGERHNNGNIVKSIDYNAKRFEISAQLTNIFRNTVNILE